MIELPKVNESQYTKLIQLGFPIKDEKGQLLPWPTVPLALQWVNDVKGFYLNLGPELYVDGINWNWQLYWYKPRNQWKFKKTHNPDPIKIGEIIIESSYDSISEGTYMFGDNNEYPTKQSAESEALSYALNYLIGGRDYAMANINPTHFREDIPVEQIE